MDNYHNTKSGDKWQLKKEGNKSTSLTADTKQKIIKETSNFMSNKIGSVKIHKQNSNIQEERTYQRRNDPRKSKV